MGDWSGNYHSLCGCIGARNECKTERETHDFYASPPEVAEELLKIETLSHRIWEPACGAGHISKVLEAAGHEVRSTDLIFRDYGTGGVDFLKTAETFPGDIVTNPPYKYAEEFVRHALETIPEGNKVCMLLKLQFLEGRKRRALFEEYPPARVLVSSSRISCGLNGIFNKKTSAGSMVAFAWYIWEKGHTGETILKWFN